MSRHLYDIGQTIKTEYGQRAIKDTDLFNEIIKHRQKYTPVKVVDYDNLTMESLMIIPPDDFFSLYLKDYKEMQENMIYGESLDFKELIEIIEKNII